LIGGFNIAVRKTAYEEVGGFNPQLLSADDWELSMKLHKRYGSKAVRYIYTLKVWVSVRKQQDVKVFYRYTTDIFANYLNLVLLDKKQVASLFNIR
jgi:hypothetical protein